MKVILSESKFNTIFSDWLEKENINIGISYSGSDLDSKDGLIIKGVVKLSQGDTPRNIERVGFIHGHIFSYKKKGDELTLRKITPDFENIGLFKIFPSEKVIEYFSNLVKVYLKKRLK